MPVAPGTYHYYLAPWALLSDPDLGDYWIPPAGTNGSIDLRPLPAQGTTAFTAGFGFFACDPAAVPEDSLLLGDDLATALTAQMRADAEAMLELSPGDLGEATVLDDLFRVLTDLSDPTGQNRVKPLMPTVSLNMDIHLGGHSLVKRVRFNPLVHTKCLDLLRLDYDRIKAESQARGDNELYLRVAGFWERKYGFDVRTTDQKRDGIRAPRTTITEDFNTADSGTMGADLTWAEVDGAWENLGNTGVVSTPAGSDSARAESDLSSDDHYAQVDIVTMVNGAGEEGGPAARFSSSANTFYSLELRSDVAARFALIKTVAGSRTGITLTETVTKSIPDTLKLNVDGSSLEGFFNGVSEVTGTDTAITGNTRCGLYGLLSAGASAGEIAFDNFEAADLAVADPEGSLIHGKLTGGGLLVKGVLVG